MATLSEIEAAIRQLPEDDIRQLATWLQEYLDEMWDQQIAGDLKSGKLDKLMAKAEADIAANRVKNITVSSYLIPSDRNCTLMSSGSIPH